MKLLIPHASENRSRQELADSWLDVNENESKFVPSKKKWTLIVKKYMS